MDKIYLGFKVREFLPGLETKPISKVEILNDNGEIVGEAGDNSGQTLTATNPDGSNEMATSILEAVEGFVYKPFSANDAIIDPSAELGDGISVAGMYSTLIQSNIDFSGGMVTANISAPINDEIEDEYPYISPIERQIQRNYAATKSIISKTTEEILLKVEALDEDLGEKYTKLNQTVESFTFEDEDGVVKIDGGVVDAEGLVVTAANITGELTIGQLPSDVATTDEIPTKTSDLTNNSGFQTESGVTSIINGTVTTDYVNALGITAYSIAGAAINVKGGGGSIYGIMYAGTNTAGSTAFEVRGMTGLRLTAAGNVFLQCSGGASLTLSGSNATIGPNLYLSSGTQITSDRKKKKDIQYMDDLDNAEIAAKYDALLDLLKFTRFKYTDGTSNRYHTALIADDVEAAIEAANLTTQDVAAFCKIPIYATDENGNPTGEIVDYTCALRYDEFIGMLIRRVQQLTQQNANINARLLTLEEKLSALGV